MAGRARAIGAAAFALGLSLAGPQATGIGSAETPGSNPGPVSAGPSNGGQGANSGSATKRTARSARDAARPVAANAESSAADTSTGTGGFRDPAPPAGVARPAATRNRTAPDTDVRPAAEVTVSGPVTPARPANTTVGHPNIASGDPVAPPAATSVAPSIADLAATYVKAPTPAKAVAVMTAAVNRFVDSAGNWVSRLPQSPATELLQGALLLVRRGLQSFLTATGWGHAGSQTPAASPYLNGQELNDYLLALAKQRYGSLFGQTVPVYNYWYEYRYLADGVVAGGPTSDTNTQVDGVDEADFVETDGRYVYVSRNGALTILDADANVASHTALSGNTVGQFLAGDRLTVITQTGGNWYGPMVKMAYGGWWNWNPQTTVTVFDVSDPTAPKVTSQNVFDGAYQDARAVDGNVYLVLNRSINLPEPLYTDVPVTRDSADLLADPARGPAVTAYRTYETWDSYVARVGGQIATLSLPHAYSVDADGNLVDLGVIAGAGDVVRPGDDNLQSQLTVVSIDSNRSGPSAFAGGVGSLVGSGGGTVYMTPETLYIATAQSNYSDTGSTTDTRIDRFAVRGTSVDWRASGVVTGTLINQFAMDEQDGYLRVATHTRRSQLTDGTWSTVNDNGVYVLDTKGRTLDVVGSVTGLAPGEDLYAVRFVGDTAYLVTFLRTDPLFAVDLGNPRAPTVQGELVIPGFSNYLQPVGDGLLLGIGQEREPGTWNTRMHVSLFDVSDGANLTQIDRQFLDEDAQWSWSEAQFDHHAVLYSAEDGLLVVPVAASGYDPQTGAYRYDTTLQVLTVDATGVTVRGVIHTDGTVSRTVRIGDVLYAIGEDHVTAYSLTDLSEIGRAPLGGTTKPAPIPLIAM